MLVQADGSVGQVIVLDAQPKGLFEDSTPEGGSAVEVQARGHRWAGGSLLGGHDHPVSAGRLNGVGLEIR